MIVGVPKEVKNHEYRVALTPSGAAALVAQGHEVYIEANAGLGSAIEDSEYIEAGATILPTADAVWATATLILKVKEPVAEEYHRIQEKHILFTYLHLAASLDCTRALAVAECTAIAYETVQLDDGSLPLLTPMSEVAGKLAPQVGFHHLMASQGGRGVLPGGVPGVAPATVVVIGGGVSGITAAEVALGMGATVKLFDINLKRLKEIDARFGGRVMTLYSTPHAIGEAVKDADLVIGAALVAGHKAPTLVTTAQVATMRKNSVLVDIAIDQGGCFEGSHPTTHDDPTFRVHNSTYYCVANMPGAVPATSTQALTNATLSYVLLLAREGERALHSDPALAKGLNLHRGVLVNSAVAAALPVAEEGIPVGPNPFTMS